jgi:7-cyano-7-deazaguanine reductase
LPNSEFTNLGRTDNTFRGLDCFPTPDHVSQVEYVSDEVSALCPVTSQPDWYTVTIRLIGTPKLIESKSLKLYLHSFRAVGIMAEALSGRIRHEIMATVNPEGRELCDVEVLVVQKSRGGISIRAEAC